MSDDSFIREVDEELRSERVQEIWKSYGKWIIAAAVAVVVGVGAYRTWEYVAAKQAAEAGDAFIASVRLADSGKVDEALTKLESLKQEGSDVYAALAGLRRASEFAKKGDVDKAVEEYDTVAAQSGIDENLRDIARLRAGALLVDSAGVTEVQARVGTLMGPGAPYRSSARETMALAYYKAGDLENAAKLYKEASADEGAPDALKNRATLMLELIAARGGPKVEG